MAWTFSTPEAVREQPIHPSDRLAFIGAMEALNCAHESGIHLDRFALRLITEGTRDGALTIWLHDLADW